VDARWQAMLHRLRDDPESLLKLPGHLWTPELVYAAVQESGSFNHELTVDVARIAHANGVLDADAAWALTQADPIWLDEWLTKGDRAPLVGAETLSDAVEAIRRWAVYYENSGAERVNTDIVDDYRGVLHAISACHADVELLPATLQQLVYLSPELLEGEAFDLQCLHEHDPESAAALLVAAVHGCSAQNDDAVDPVRVLKKPIENCRELFREEDTAPLLWRSFARAEAIETLWRVGKGSASGELLTCIARGLEAGADGGEVDMALAANPQCLGPLLRLGAKLSDEQVLKAVRASGDDAATLVNVLFEDGAPLHRAAKEACWAVFEHHAATPAAASGRHSLSP
jgi:hypothetical protein